MRIAIAGASGTGKTTLARAISEKYGWPLNPVGARAVAKSMGFDNPYDVDAAGKREEFQSRLLLEKLEWELAHDSFVSDRTYVDNLAYCALHMADKLSGRAVNNFTRQMRRYDCVFHIPKGVFQKLDDGIRVTNQAYHELYEILLDDFLYNKSECRIYELGCKLEERQEIVFGNIDSHIARRERALAER